jgi:hypothetical protein
MVCGLRMYLGRGAGTLGPYGAIWTRDRGERIFEEGEFVFTRDRRVDSRTIESELPAKEMTRTTFGTNVGDANRPSTKRILIPLAG